LFFKNHFYLKPFEQILTKFNINLTDDTFRLQSFGLTRGTIFKDFTNISALGILFLDFGYLGLIEYFFLFYLFSYIYTIYVKKGTTNLVVFSIYPAFVIMGLEFARIFYFYETRVLIPIIVFFLFYYLQG
jgi:hypothetical protein